MSKETVDFFHGIGGFAEFDNVPEVPDCQRLEQQLTFALNPYPLPNDLRTASIVVVPVLFWPMKNTLVFS
jgi:hypothetical protein